MKLVGEIISPEIDFKSGICAVCRKHKVNRWCDFIIKYNNEPIFYRTYKLFSEANKRGNQYETCDLPMCEECAENVSHDTDLCPHHYKLMEQAELPVEYQRERQKREKFSINTLNFRQLHK